MATFTNAYLNSGYTIGLLSEIAVEEAGMAALELATGGGAAPMVAARSARNSVRAGKAMNSIGRMTDRVSSTVGRLRDLKNVGKAKNFYNAAKNVGRAVNPLRGTTEFLATAGRQYKRSASTGKIEKLGSMAKLQRGFGTFYRDLREINLAVDEARLEKGFVENKTKTALVNEFIDEHGHHPTAKDMEKINEQAFVAGQNTLFHNTWLIYATNRIAFGNYFNKWMPRAMSNTGKKIAGGGS